MNNYLNSSNAFEDIKSFIKKIKGLTYHKRSKKFQVQVFFNDPDNIVVPSTKKHIFKSKSFFKLKDALIGRNAIIDFIINHPQIGTHNPAANFNKKTYQDLINQYPIINYYLSQMEPETLDIPQPPRTNNECYICMCEFEDGEETLAICGNPQHHIHKECHIAASQAAQNPHEYLGTMDTNSKCGICRQPATNGTTDLQAKQRNHKRRVFRSYW